MQFVDASNTLKAFLKKVASGPDAPYYDYAPDPTALKGAFHEIANHLSELRLSKQGAPHPRFVASLLPPGEGWGEGRASIVFSLRAKVDEEQVKRRRQPGEVSPPLPDDGGWRMD